MVKIFCGADHFNRFDGLSIRIIDEIQEKANEFMTQIENDGGEIHDVKLQVLAVSEDYLVWSLLIFYQP